MTQYILRNITFNDPANPDLEHLTLTFQLGGSLLFSGVYSGPLAERVWFDDDYEFWMRVPASHARQFWALMMKDALAREATLSFYDLRTLVTEAGIPVEEWDWA